MGRGALCTHAHTGAQPMAAPVHFSFPYSLPLPFPPSLSLSLLFPLSRPRPRWRRKKSWTPTPLLPPPPQPTNITSAVLNTALMLLGSGGSLLLCLYFVHDGHHLWLSTFLQVSAWPILLLPLSISHLYSSQPSGPSPPAAAAASSSSSRGPSVPPLPSSASLSPSTATSTPTAPLTSHSRPPPSSWPPIWPSLLFTAVFSFLIVHQHFTPFSLNSVVLLMLGPIILSLGGGDNRLIPTFSFSP